MNDRELLERAARAAGIELGEWMEVGVHSGFAVAYGIRPAGVCWNPLNDEGDALRLAVQLGLEIEIRPSATCVFKSDRQFPSYSHAVGAYAATRRAIVRAAAELCP